MFCILKNDFYTTCGIFKDTSSTLISDDFGTLNIVAVKWWTYLPTSNSKGMIIALF